MIQTLKQKMENISLSTYQQPAKEFSFISTTKEIKPNGVQQISFIQLLYLYIISLNILNHQILYIVNLLTINYFEFNQQFLKVYTKARVIMNIAELNFVNRHKIQKQVILPHVPTYVLKDGEKNNDVWYFMSEKYITLKKKKQNTHFWKFIKQKKQDLQFEPIQKQHNQKETNPSLVFMVKQSLNYIPAKVSHILKDHMFSQNRYQAKNCAICQQIEKNDYNFLLIERERLIQKLAERQKQIDQNNKDSFKIKKDQKLSGSTPTSFVIQELDYLMESVLFGKQNHVLQRQSFICPENNDNLINQADSIQPTAHQLPHSTFNPYFPLSVSPQGFRYSLSRIEINPDKVNFMKMNKNRINYRRQVNKNSMCTNKDNFMYIDGSQLFSQVFSKTEQLLGKINSTLWNSQFLIFDLEKVLTKTQKPPVDNKSNTINNHPQRVINSHMKQKIASKCQTISKFLQDHFASLFRTCLLNSKDSLKYPHEEKQLISSKVKIKSFRLWYFNNNQKNNHIYTICLSDVKVEFIVQNQHEINSKYQVDFFTKIDLNHLYRLQKPSQSNHPIVTNKQSKQGSRLEQSTGKLKSQELLNSQFPLFPQKKYTKFARKQVSNTKQLLVAKGKHGFYEASSQVNLFSQSQKCQCCLEPIQTENLFPSQKMIIYRHVNKLRQLLQQKLNQSLKSIQGKSLEIQSKRTGNFVQQENLLVQKLYSIKDKLARVKDLNEKVNKNPQNIKMLKNQYEQAVVCEDCYQIFLSNFIKTNKKQSILKKIINQSLNTVSHNQNNFTHQNIITQRALSFQIKKKTPRTYQLHEELTQYQQNRRNMKALRSMSQKNKGKIWLQSQTYRKNAQNTSSYKYYSQNPYKLEQRDTKDTQTMNYTRSDVQQQKVHSRLRSRKQGYHLARKIAQHEAYDDSHKHKFVQERNKLKEQNMIDIQQKNKQYFYSRKTTKDNAQEQIVQLVSISPHQISLNKINGRKQGKVNFQGKNKNNQTFYSINQRQGGQMSSLKNNKTRLQRFQEQLEQQEGAF